ncbi:hypothetical protein LF1_39350 [Rubripirellula obstinata]|uniref:DUF4272 domain-containing protein n=2 Tax=Rubripirellula obstinata TaxID=406547 RepID=A0A5B1CJV7_9BACT|nr:hypothetical protein LF1_39350 [Rubripirellula obstinata]
MLVYHEKLLSRSANTLPLFSSMIVTAYSTLRQDSQPDFPCEILETKSRQNSDLVGHLNSVMGWACDFGKLEMTQTLFAVLQHLERTRNWYQFDVMRDDLDAMTAWGIKTNSIFGMPDRSLRDPKGAVLVDRENDSVDEEARVPHPIDAVERSIANRKLLADRGIDVMEDLPPSIGEDEVILRSADEVGWRTLALFIVAVRAESLASGNPIASEQLRSKSPMSFEALTPSEQAFLENDGPDQQTVVNFAWRYEALYALQWALGLHAELKSPTEICDVPAVAETMVDRSDRELVTETRLRPVDELLDALDLNYQMLWAARQAKTQGRETPAGLDGGVLVERQHALNWLICFAGADWDDVDTPS